ncbi:hypothetical protein IGI04_000488 [Brassica rapa subsp. trilocularis]|uniref:Uncharacterized protein n=1 Tax=Brassica rapa subsp. trilocularis TaxID=1813537 RepID=A0ABQ7NPX1_BRACM|nr:hypothetical protein IGI04_000488 [Brassica rapa subsp. trilocularis]
MKRNDKKEFQSQVKNSSGHFRNLAWPWVLSQMNPKCRVSKVSTSIDGTCVHRSTTLMRIDRLFFLSSTSTWSARVKRPLSSKMLPTKI